MKVLVECVYVLHWSYFNPEIAQPFDFTPPAQLRPIGVDYLVPISVHVQLRVQ